MSEDGLVNPLIRTTTPRKNRSGLFRLSVRSDDDGGGRSGIVVGVLCLVLLSSLPLLLSN